MDPIKVSLDNGAVAAVQDHRIDVSFVDGRVRAEPNPLPDPQSPVPLTIRSRDIVTWFLPGHRLDLEVEFTAVRDITPPLPEPPPPLLPTGPNGPLVSLTHLGDRIVGMIGDFDQTPPPPLSLYRFFYKILQDGVPLEWDNSVGDAPDLINGGGVDIPAKPPGKQATAS